MRKTHPLLPLLLIIALSLSITMCGKTKPTEEKLKKEEPKEPEIKVEEVANTCLDVFAWQYNCPSTAACNECIDKDNCPDCVAQRKTLCLSRFRLLYSCPSNAACDNCYDNDDCSACTQVIFCEGIDEDYICPNWDTHDKCYDNDDCSACSKIFDDDFISGDEGLYKCTDEDAYDDCRDNNNCSECTPTGKFECDADDGHVYICPNQATHLACEDNNDYSGCIRSNIIVPLLDDCHDPSGQEHYCPYGMTCDKCERGDCSECVAYCEGSEDRFYFCPDAAACATCASQGQCSTCTRIE